MEQLLIPERINVGFNKRSDTYTTKLGYVIYYDQKGVLRKEKSWQGWRDQSIAPQEFKNEPTEGFVLNRSVGGYKSDWHYRSAKIRIYDPRDWEFEISLENLLFVLAVGDCSRGKGLEGKFVYAWQGQDLILLPVASEAYTKSQNFTALQTQSVKGKDLVPGVTYITKKQQVLLYLGRFDWHFMVRPDYRSGYNDKLQRYNYNKKDMEGVIQRYVFWDEAAYQQDLKWKAKTAKIRAKALRKLKADKAAGKQNLRSLQYYIWDVQTGDDSDDDDDEMYDFYDCNTNVGFVYHDTPKQIAAVSTTTPNPKFAELVERFYKSDHGSKVVSLFLKKEKPKAEDEDEDYGWFPWAHELDDGSFVEATTHYDRNSLKETQTNYQTRHYLKDGVLFEDSDHRGCAMPDSKKGNYHKSYGTLYPWVEPTKNRLWAKMESGSEFMIDSQTFCRGR